MKFHFLGAISLALGISACNPAYADGACQSEGDFVTEVVSDANPGLNIGPVATLQGLAVTQVLQAFNDTPPSTSFEADEILILHATRASDGEEHPQWLVALFKDHCKVTAAMVPAAKFRQLVGPNA
jgi:hypothetical protein